MAETLLEVAKVTHTSWDLHHEEAQLLPGSQIRRTRDLVTDLLSQAVTKVDFEEIYGSRLRDSATMFAYQCILSCVETGNQYLLGQLSARLATISGGPAGAILVPLLMRLDTLIKTFPKSLLPIFALQDFYKVSLRMFLRSVDLDNPSVEDVSILLRPVIWSGDGRMLQSV